MTPHEINILIERYLDGETTLAEERALALAVQREDRPAEWAIIAEMLGELTVDEAVWPLPQPLPEWREEVTTSINSSQETAVSTPLHSDFCPSITRGARGEWGMGWVRWAAAACITLAFGLSYNIIKEEPKKTAKTQLQAPTKTQQQEPKQAPAKAQQQAPAKAQQPLLIAAIAPSNTVLSCDASHDNTVSPADNTPTSTSNAPKEAPLPESQPQLMAELEEATPPEDLSLCMALIAEVEARAFQAELSEQQLYQALLDEILVNIQQQSNRPELSL